MQSVVMERQYVAESQRKRRGHKQSGAAPEFPRVAAALRAVRKAYDLTQEQMAPILGITFAGYRPYERGERDLTQSQIETIATALEIPVSEITRRLWPDDVRLIETAYSTDFEELKRQVADLPPEVAARIVQGWRESVEVINHATDIARGGRRN